MRLGGKSDEQGTLGGSIKIPESGKGLTHPEGRIIKAQQMTAPLEKDTKREQCHKGCSAQGAICFMKGEENLPTLKSSS